MFEKQINLIKFDHFTILLCSFDSSSTASHFPYLWTCGGFGFIFLSPHFPFPSLQTGKFFLW